MVNVLGGEGVLFKDSARISSIASPGFVYGKQGTVKNAYIDFAGVPSNNTGFYNYLTNSVLLSYAIATSTSGTYGVEIYEHDLTTFTLIDSLVVTASSFGSKNLVTPIALTTGKRVAVKIDNTGKSTNPVVFLFIRGDQ